jgi:hypothetical protein
MFGRIMNRIERNIIPIMIVSFLSLLAFLFAKDPDNFFQCNSKPVKKTKDTPPGNRMDTVAGREQKKKWEYSKERNEMGDSIKIAMLNSTNIVHFDFPYNGGSIGRLIVRRRNRSLDLMFSVIKGQIDFDLDGIMLRVRFDDEPARKYRASQSESGSSDILFFNNENDLLARIRRSSKMAVEVPFFSHGREIFIFDVEGLEMR